MFMRSKSSNYFDCKLQRPKYMDTSGDGLSHFISSQARTVIRSYITKIVLRMH